MLGEEEYRTWGRTEYFKGEFPINTLVEIRALAEPGLDVEIEATVLLES